MSSVAFATDKGKRKQRRKALQTKKVHVIDIRMSQPRLGV